MKGKPRARASVIGAVAALLAAALALASAAQAQLQLDYDKIEIGSLDLGSGVHVLTDSADSSGNIGLLAGPDGVLMIDAKYAPLSDKIKAEVAKLQAGPVRFLVNTHHHPDHTGGNAAFGAAGATIVAQENARKRLSSEQHVSPTLTLPAQPQAAWPIVTFTKDVTFHMDGQTVHVFHVPAAHTDNDSMVYFEEANILHTGDVFITPGVPFVDASGGGSLTSFIAALDAALAVANDQTKIIPGHGAISTRADVVRTREKMQKLLDVLKPLADSNLTIKEILAKKPVDAYGDAFGGLVTPDLFVQGAIESMRAENKAPPSPP
jgi:glyoxylase-like metal-dependent hydrolase (beta-lactamase superfamily II)